MNDDSTRQDPDNYADRLTRLDQISLELRQLAGVARDSKGGLVHTDPKTALVAEALELVATEIRMIRDAGA